ncbi:TetR/AcrR family transcriptional regulator [Georgenia alba]|uniref:TetR family transcriptional regulator n=1 Tax=Georgenia alba TaxID=2233858 RepID=A0ABW2Q3A9_9MICO
MRSQEELGGTRGRILEAAIERFGRDGFGASVRAIAADAGVSAALVIKLFGSKEALHEECDEQVLAAVRDAKRSTISSASLSTTFLNNLALIDEYQPILRYCLRSFMTGGTVARHLIDHMVADAVEYSRDAVEAGIITPSRDEEARIRFLVGAWLGNVMLSVTTEERDLGEVGADFWHRQYFDMASPMLEVLTEGYFTDHSILDQYLLYIGDPPGAEGRPA